MKARLFAVIAASILLPQSAFAQESDENRLQGLHVGVDVTRDSNEASQRTSTRNESRSGFGGRAHVGYDAVLGNVILAGVEIGAGLGGKTIDQASLLAPGRYKVNPGLSYDATARLGISPVNGLAIYGRAGYRWLKTEQSVTEQSTGNFSNKVTEKGFTYGGGIEYAATDTFALRAEFNRTKYSPELRQNKISIGASIRF